MISKPTTEQILLDCSRELMEVVLPAVTDETVKVSVLMLDVVLRNTAERAAHEIAWMSEEIEELDDFVRSAAGSDGPVHDTNATPTQDGSLHLGEVVERYRRASEAFSEAMDSAVAARHDRLVARGVSLLERRVERETMVMSGWSPVGR